MNYYVVICGMEKVDTRIPKDLKEKIIAEAKEYGRTFCGQLRFMLLQYFKEKK